MVRALNKARLRTGEDLHVAAVDCPDGEHADELSVFYCHKEEHWVCQIEESLTRSMDELETRFYMGRVDGELAGGIATYEHQGVGILSHVYTEPTWRGRGIATAITAAVMRDFSSRGGRFLTLGTDYGSQAYRIYERAGFRSAGDHAGTMVWEARPGSHGEYFAAQRCGAVPMAWHHWPALCALLATEAGGVYAKSWYSSPWLWFENDFLLIMQRVGQGAARARVLEGEMGSVLGYAEVSLRWPGTNKWQLDLYAYPGFWNQAGLLLASLGELPERVRCYADEGAERRKLLQAAGFTASRGLAGRWGREKTATMMVLERS